MHREVSGGVATYPREEVMCPMTTIPRSSKSRCNLGRISSSLNDLQGGHAAEPAALPIFVRSVCYLSSHETPAKHGASERTNERTSERARCALVESERRLNRLPVHFYLCQPAEGGGPPLCPLPALVHTHT